MQALLIELFAGALISIGFAIMYNTPRNVLVWSAIFGIIAMLVKISASEILNFRIEFATFFGALTIGILTEMHKSKSFEIRRVLSVPPMLQMIPGKYAFDTLVAWGNFWNHPNEVAILMHAINMQLKTMLIIIFLVLGITLPSILFKNRHPLKKVMEVAHMLHHKN